VRAQTEDRSDESKENFNEEFNHFPKYHIKIILRDSKVKLRRKDIFKPTIRNDSIYGKSNDKDVRLVNFATLTNLVVKSTTFPYRNTNTPGLLLMRRLKFILMTS
jgi:hypothetical protein